MKWTLPGTVLKIEREDAQHAEALFSSMFLGGGIVLSQVAGITGVEAYTVQNWVKRGFLPPPERKRYTMRQLCRIININLMKSALPMERICALLSYLNGQLDDEADDLIDDAELYFRFVRIAACAAPDMDLDAAIREAVRDCGERVPGARERIGNALKIMLTAYFTSALRRQTEEQLKALLPGPAVSYDT